MCTVTFVPRRAGYCLAMNRDEQRSRPLALPPNPATLRRFHALFPSEPGGGTWICLNEMGGCFALVNWYSANARVDGKAVSRGEVIPAVGSARSWKLADAQLARLPLERINPFRLVGIFPGTGQILEWRWDLNRLVRKAHRWQMQHWVSSGFDEAKAQRMRGRHFRQARAQRSAGSLDWLRRLHRSHVPARGPFSHCMHREDAVTVSYTEIIVSRTHAQMHYLAQAPCKARGQSRPAGFPLDCHRR